ncbi:MAG: ribosomal L7Ae/L30e/S12e/Gadd45 family protein [Candidatus Woesearchaeota archaeon]
MTYQEDIRNAILAKKHVFGPRVTIKKLRSKHIAKIYLAKNINPVTEQDIQYYATISGTPVEKLSISNEELSVICKRPHLINVVAIQV